MVRYKTAYPQAYDEGSINKSIRISFVAAQLLDENEVENDSAFINDLLIEALQEKDFFKKRCFKQLNSITKEIKDKYGINVFLKVEGVDENEPKPF